jgi:hypothetical protein
MFTPSVTFQNWPKIHSHLKVSWIRSLDGLLIYQKSQKKEQETEKLRSKRFSIQIDEPSDYSGIGHLVACEQYVADAIVNKDMPLCKHKKKSNNKTTLQN